MFTHQSCLLFCLKSSIRQPSNSSVVADLLVIDPSPKQSATTGKYSHARREIYRMEKRHTGGLKFYCVDPGGNSDLISGFADFSSPAASASLPTSTGKHSLSIIHRHISLYFRNVDFAVKLTLDSNGFKMLSLAAPSSSGNGEFGDWNAFSASPPTLSNSGPPHPSNDLFGSAQSPPSSKPDPVSPSAELFDLMGVNQQLTNQHATLSASQSLTFSLGGAAPGASVAMPTVPLSRSQQVCFRVCICE